MLRLQLQSSHCTFNAWEYRGKMISSFILSVACLSLLSKAAPAPEPATPAIVSLKPILPPIHPSMPITPIGPIYPLPTGIFYAGNCQAGSPPVGEGDVFGMVSVYSDTNCQQPISCQVIFSTTPTCQPLAGGSIKATYLDYKGPQGPSQVATGHLRTWFWPRWLPYVNLKADNPYSCSASASRYLLHNA